MANSRSSLVNVRSNGNCHSECSEESLSHQQPFPRNGCFRFTPFSVSMTRGILGIGIVSLLVVSLSACSVNVKENKNTNGDKDVTIKSPIADMHIGKDVEGADTGISVYPGARLVEKDDDGGSDRANLNISTALFGLKLVVVKYASDDAPEKVVAFYRNDLKKYGKVSECKKEGKDPHVNVDLQSGGDSKHASDKKCSGDGKGETVELSVGNDDNHHIVAVSPKGKGSEFALVYVRTRDDKTI